MNNLVIEVDVIERMRDDLSRILREFENASRNSDSAAARTGVVSTAATSIMHSAAGSGISGITRPVAMVHVIDLIRPQTGMLAGSSFSELVQLGTLANTPLLLSGATSQAVVGAQRSAVLDFIAEVVYAGSDPLVGAGIGAIDPYRGLPMNSWRNSNW